MQNPVQVPLEFFTQGVEVNLFSYLLGHIEIKVYLQNHQASFDRYCFYYNLVTINTKY